jgi:hypothetical protein
MSTFNGVNLFGSPHKIAVGPFAGRMAFNTIPGVSGAFSQNFGIAPRQITVEGIMSASSVANLKTAIALVLSYVNEYSYPFVDNQSDLYPYCQLVSFSYGHAPGGYSGRFTPRAVDVITYFRAEFVQLAPHYSAP